MALAELTGADHLVEPGTRRAQPATRRRWGPEHVFPGLILGFGLAFAFGMPPCQAPDEVSHLFRSYQVSEGRPFPAMVGDWAGGDLPAGVFRITTTFGHIPFHGDRQATREHFTTLLETPLAPGERITTTFPGSAHYSCVPYLPQAAGMALARVVGFGPLGIFYAGRLANLVLAVLLVHAALRITPVFKLVVGIVALIPMTVHQFASLSPDASTIAAALLLTALLLRLAAAGETAAGRGTIAALLAGAGWLTLCKFPYAAIALLYLAVRPARMGGWGRYLVVGSALVLIIAVLGLAGARLKKYAPDRLTTDPAAGVSIERQLKFIRSHPLRYARICAATVAEHGRVWLDQMGTLGWLDTPVNPLAMHAFFTVLVLVALGDRGGSAGLGLRVKCFACLAAVACAGVILTCCYVAGCRVKAPLIIGPQGRYFIPLLPLFLLVLHGRVVRVEAPPRLLQAVAAGAGAAVLLAAVCGLVRRYYFHPDLQPSFAAAALTAALALFVTVVALAKGRWAPA